MLSLALSIMPTIRFVIFLLINGSMLLVVLRPGYVESRVIIHRIERNLPPLPPERMRSYRRLMRIFGSMFLFLQVALAFCQLGDGYTLIW